MLLKNAQLVKVHFCIDDLCHRNICRQSQVHPDHWEQGWQGWVERYYLDSKWLESNSREAGVGEGSEQPGMLDLLPFAIFYSTRFTYFWWSSCDTMWVQNRNLGEQNGGDDAYLKLSVVVLRWQLLWTILKLQSLEQISLLAGLKAIVRSTYFHYAYRMPSFIHHCSASSHYQALVLWLLVVVLCLFLY